MGGEADARMDESPEARNFQRRELQALRSRAPKARAFQGPESTAVPLLDFIADFANWDNSTVRDTGHEPAADRRRPPSSLNPEFRLSDAELPELIRIRNPAIRNWPRPLVADPSAAEAQFLSKPCAWARTPCQRP